MVIDPLTEKWNTVSPYTYALNNPLIIIDLDGRDNTIYLQVDKSAYKDFSKADIRNMVKQANANFREMGLNTRVVMAKGEVDISRLSKTDAVAVLGRTKDVQKAVSRMNSLFAQSLTSLGDNKRNVNPEFSQNGDMGSYGNNIIALESGTINSTSKFVKTNKVEWGAFLINHGAGHNTEIRGHGGETVYEKLGTSIKELTIPGGTVMSSGDNISNAIKSGTKELRDFISSPDNKSGYIYNHFIQRFGNQQSNAKLPHE